MLINGQAIDDFKTPRKDLLPALPLVYRMVPIIFYLALIFVAIVGSLATWHTRVASTRYQDIVRQTAQVEKDIKTTKAARAELEKNYRESTQLYSWVESSVPLQPLVVAIIKSMQPGSTIVSLTLERDAATPAQLKLALTINSESDDQILHTLDAIRAMGYLEFSPTQSKVKGNLEYRALLVRSKTATFMDSSPQDRQETVVQ
jgi:hypothetical protein